MSEIRSEKAYEALGRFVEAFESMVHETRSITIRLLSDNKNMHHRGLIEIAFHHSCMTAKPLFEIFRAIIIQIVNVSIEAQEIRKTSGSDDYPLPIVDNFGKSVSFTPSDRETFLGVLKTIAKEYGDLIDLAPAVKREAEEDWGNRRSPLLPPWSVEVSCSKILDWKSSKFFYSGRYRSSCVTARQIMLYQKAPLVPFFTGIM